MRITEGPVPRYREDVAVAAAAFQIPPRGLRQARDQLDGYHRCRERAQHRGEIARARAHIQDVFAAGQLQQFGHECGHVRLRNGLLITNRNRLIAVRQDTHIGRHKLFARNHSHRSQNPFVPNPAAVQLRFHHRAAFRFPIRNQDNPAFIIKRVTHQVTLIPGDGIGPEVAEATIRAVDATGASIEWERVEAGLGALEEYGELLPGEVFASLEISRVGLKGPTATPIGGGHQSINVQLRKKLGLYTNFRPVRMLPGLKTRFHDVPVNLAIFRENTEDLYSGLEHEVVPGVVESLKIITNNASMRIARAAFEYARRDGRCKVTAIHKANIMKLSDGLFLKCCREVASGFPEIQYNELIVDNACMQLVMRPETFDILLLPNLYGDIISDLAAGLVGGLGIVPGANMGDHHAIFEAVHGTAPDIAGKGLANPTALMQSAVLMLAHLGERDAAARLQQAIERVYAESRCLTSDVGGKASTNEFTCAVIAHL